ncbi:MAG: lysophospholipid acyltransferase family protein [Candidatus Taylorbacteria bacterium]
MTFLRISQFLTWPIAFVYFHLFYRLRINGRENFNKVNSPFIIIVNHFSFVDSFLFRLILGFSTPHLPLRFMAVEKFSWKWLNFLSEIGVVPFIFSIFGVFVVVPGLGLQKNLEKAKKIISKKGNIVIYPEGKIVTEHVIAPFRSGAAVLAIETNTPVVPVSLRLGDRHHIRKDLIVNIGEPLRIGAEGDVEVTIKMFYESILVLYGKV